jgi:DNA polymerase III epsilon subunit-like protein
MEYAGLIASPNYKLHTECTHLGINLKDAHDALADVKATRELMMLINEMISIRAHVSVGN